MSTFVALQGVTSFDYACCLAWQSDIRPKLILWRCLGNDVYSRCGRQHADLSTGVVYAVLTRGVVINKGRIPCCGQASWLREG